MNRLPLILAIVLLLLPVVYVGSYLALVEPYADTGHKDGVAHYRTAPAICRTAFWPLEQIDRKIRPKFWERSW